MEAGHHASGYNAALNRMISHPTDRLMEAASVPRGTLPLMIEREPIWRLCSVLALVVSFVISFWILLGGYWSLAHPGVDQNGYLVGGKNLADHFSTGFTPTDPYQFVGEMWVAGGRLERGKNGESIRYYPKYPIGMPLLIAIAVKLGAGVDGYGAIWAYCLSPMLMGLALPAIFLLTRQVAGSVAGLIALLIVGSSPVTLCLANNPNSHAAALCFVSWGMYLLLGWWQRGGGWRALGAGLLLGFAGMTRYTEALLIIPIVLVILFNLRWKNGRSWLEAGLLMSGWLAPILLQLAVNRSTLGHWTGYGPTQESDAFGLDHLARNWEHLLRQLNGTAMVLTFPIGLMGLMLLAARNARLALVLAAWVIPSALVYGAYYWAPRDENPITYARFFLTILPPLALGAGWCLTRGLLLTASAGPANSTPSNRASNRALRWVVAPAIAGLLTFSAVACNVAFSKPLMQMEQHRGSGAALAARELMTPDRVPPGATVIAPRAMLTHLQFATDFRLYDAALFTRSYVQALKNQTPDEPSLLQYERARALVDLLKGKSDADLGKLGRRISADAIAEGRRVFIVVPAGSSDSAVRKAMVDATLERSDKLPLKVKSMAVWTEIQLKGQAVKWELLEVLRR